MAYPIPVGGELWLYYAGRNVEPLSLVRASLPLSHSGFCIKLLAVILLQLEVFPNEVSLPRVAGILRSGGVASGSAGTGSGGLFVGSLLFC